MSVVLEALILRPSGGERWGPDGCEGSHFMEAHYPEEDGEEALEGTAAHEYLIGALRGNVLPVGTVTSNGVAVSEDMTKGAAIFYEMINKDYKKGLDVYLEHRVTAHKLVHPKCEGTPDMFWINWELHEIHVRDYKYGHGYVDAFRNWQLVCYLAGVIEMLNLTRDELKGWKIVLGIVQPRNWHPEGQVRRWTLIGHKAFEYIDLVSDAAYAAKEPDAPTRAGPACRHCTATAGCEALLRSAGNYLDYVGKAVPHEMTPEALAVQVATIRAGIKRLEALNTGLTQVALHKIRREGKLLPGLSVEFGKGREKWVKPLAEVKAMGELMGLTLTKEEAITPNQARSLGLDESLLKTYATVPLGEARLVIADQYAAAKVFE